MTNILFRLGLLLIVAASFSGCTQADLDAAMARAKAVSAAIKNGAAVTASAVRQGIDDACASQAAAGIAYQTARAILLQQTGPNTTANIDALDKAMTGYTTVCAQAQDPTRSDLSSLLSRAIAAYAAFQAAKSKAGV